MDAGWRRLPSLVLKGSPRSYRSAPETAGSRGRRGPRNGPRPSIPQPRRRGTPASAGTRCARAQRKAPRLSRDTNFCALGRHELLRTRGFDSGRRVGSVRGEAEGAERPEPRPSPSRHPRLGTPASAGTRCARAQRKAPRPSLSRHPRLGTPASAGTRCARAQRKAPRPSFSRHPRRGTPASAGTRCARAQRKAPRPSPSRHPRRGTPLQPAPAARERSRTLLAHHFPGIHGLERRLQPAPAARERSGRLPAHHFPGIHGVERRLQPAPASTRTPAFGSPLAHSSRPQRTARDDGNPVLPPVSITAPHRRAIRGSSERGRRRPPSGGHLAVLDGAWAWNPHR